MMNETRPRIGLEDTNYVDCTGRCPYLAGTIQPPTTKRDCSALLWGMSWFQGDLRLGEVCRQRAREIKNSHPSLEKWTGWRGETGATTPAGHTLITSTLAAVGGSFQSSSGHGLVKRGTAESEPDRMGL